jgi:hypothetical protein
VIVRRRSEAWYARVDLESVVGAQLTDWTWVVSDVERETKGRAGLGRQRVLKGGTRGRESQVKSRTCRSWSAKKRGPWMMAHESKVEVDGWSDGEGERKRSAQKKVRTEAAVIARYARRHRVLACGSSLVPAPSSSRSRYANGE